MRSSAVAKVGALVVLVGASTWGAVVLDVPDLEAMRAYVDAAGPWGPWAFLGSYAALALLPLPRPLLTVAGGVLFGFWTGAGLALGAALLSGTVSFGLARLLGRDAVERLTRGRAARLEEVLGRRGLLAVATARLVPVAPFLAVNYACGLAGIRLRHFVIGSALGMAPGSLVYAAVGAYGAGDPGDLAATSRVTLAVAVTVLLAAAAVWWVRRKRAL